MISTPKALRPAFHRTYAPIIIRCLYSPGVFHERTAALFARCQTAPERACVFGCDLEASGLCADCGGRSRGSRSSLGVIWTNYYAGGLGQRVETGLQRVDSEGGYHGFSMAGGLRGFFSEPVEPGTCGGVYHRAGGTS